MTDRSTPERVAVVIPREVGRVWLTLADDEHQYLAPRTKVATGEQWDVAASRVARSVFGEAPFDLVPVTYVVPEPGNSRTLGVFIAAIDDNGAQIAPEDSTLIPVELDDPQGIAEELARDAATVIGLQAVALQGVPKITRKDLVAFLSERIDVPANEFTASFDCEVSSSRSVKTGPQDVPLAEALAWGRSVAPRVTLQVGSDRYSAGERESYDGYPRWTGRTDVQRRETGWKSDFDDA